MSGSHSELTQLSQELEEALDNLADAELQIDGYRQNIRELEEDVDELQRRLTLLRSHIPYTIWQLAVADSPEMELWFTSDNEAIPA